MAESDKDKQMRQLLNDLEPSSLPDLPEMPEMPEIDGSDPDGEGGTRASLIDSGDATGAREDGEQAIAGWTPDEMYEYVADRLRDG